jgi:hypothetical protein
VQGVTLTLIDTNRLVEGAGSDCAMPRRGAVRTSFSRMP